jgi:hypothetical protein
MMRKGPAAQTASSALSWLENCNYYGELGRIINGEMINGGIIYEGNNLGER